MSEDKEKEDLIEAALTAAVDLITTYSYKGFSVNATKNRMKRIANDIERAVDGK